MLDYSKKLLFIGILAAAFSVFEQVAFGQDAELHMIYVGQGHATLIRSEGKTIIYDLGGEAEAFRYTIPYLKSIGVTEIDMAWVSHPHDDHVAGLEPILNSGIRIKSVMHSKVAEGISDFAYDPQQYFSMLSRIESRGVNVVEVKTGELYKLGGIDMLVIAAHKGAKVGDKPASVNDFSIVLKVRAGGVDTLFTGDLNHNKGTELLGNPHLKADVFQVPHHGVTHFAPIELWDEVHAQLNLIPSTKQLWHHPRSEQTRAWSEHRNHDNPAFDGTVILKYKDGMVIESDNSFMTQEKCSPLKSFSNLPINLAPILSLLLDD